MSTFVTTHPTETELVNGASRQADNGDGTYTNPPLYADYPDPDIIRVGDDFYFATTTFVNSPGLRILHSKDLVNWQIVGDVIPRLEGLEAYDMQGGTSYRVGVFAPSLRYYEGTFFIAMTPPGLPIHIFRAANPAGPWESWSLNHEGFDPGLFIDSDGTGYIATAAGWDGTITLLTLDREYRSVVAEQKIHYVEGAEGSKLIRCGEWLYIFNAIPRRLALTVSRAKSLFGPWETREQIDDTSGGHQGALVDLPDGGWYGFVMCDYGPIGRMTNISPIYFEDGWPIWGTPDAPMQVPARAIKPIQGHPLASPATSDYFNAPTLGAQWAWNHNPDNSRWSLTERPGFLRLHSTQATEFWTARNTLTQKGWGPWSRGEVKFDLNGLKTGDICGFGTLGKFNGHITVSRKANGDLVLGMNVIEDTTAGQQTEVRLTSQPLSFSKIWLRTDMDYLTNRAECAFSLDGQNWTNLGDDFPLAYDWQTGTFQGQQYAIFCYNPNPTGGFVDVEEFRFYSK